MLGNQYQGITSVSADYTALVTDDLIVVNASAAARTITLYDPTGKFFQSGVPTGSGPGRVRIVTTAGSIFPVTIATAAGTIIGQTILRGQNQAAECIADGLGNWYVVTPQQNKFRAVVALSAAAIFALNATPLSLLPAPGLAKINLVERIALKMITTATQFANGGALEFRYTDASGAKVTADIAAAVVTAAAGTSYTTVAGVTTSLTAVVNALICVRNPTAAYDSGTGSAVICIDYRVEDFS